MQDRTIMVTGASSGIGRSVAILLSQLGARVILVARREAQLNETSALLDGIGHRVEPFDLLATEAIPAWMQRVCETTGPLQGLVHAAGIVSTAPVRFTEMQGWTDTIRANLETAFGLAKGFRQKTVSTRPASVVFIASVAALVGIPGKSAYSASKGGLISMVRSFAAEFAREHIRVNCVAPGWVETEMTTKDAQDLTTEQLESMRQRHMLGFGQPVDVAHAIAFLLADTGRWLTGSTLTVDGGFSAQ